MSAERKQHWETVYNTKQPHEVSWTQQVPETSLSLIRSFALPKSAAIIDVGGGDSTLVDFLLDEGYENITILDISERALERAKARLGARASQVKWIATDITTFQPTEQYDLWHDRAAFHFLTTPAQVQQYITIAVQAIKSHLIIATFSQNGPKKCSGLDITQYSESQLQALLSPYFQKTTCITEDHTTPFNTTQNFLFCSFRKISK